MDFNTAYGKYKGYIAQVAMNANNWDNLNTKEDLMQELAEVLFHCVKRYDTIDDKSLDKILKTAFHNRISNLLKSKRIERQGIVSIDNKDNKGKPFSAGLTKHIMTDKDYQDGINDIVANLPNDSAMKALDVMNPQNRGIFIKGTRKAYGEVQTYLRKD